MGIEKLHRPILLPPDQMLTWLKDIPPDQFQVALMNALRMKDITRTDFDALTDAEKDDGSIYLIDEDN